MYHMLCQVLGNRSAASLKLLSEPYLPGLHRFVQQPVDSPAQRSDSAPAQNWPQVAEAAAHRNEGFYQMCEDVCMFLARLT